MPDRVALYLQDVHTIQDSIKFVQHAEMCGFDAVWQAESRLARDATVPMSAYAAATHRIKIGSAVMNIWTRNPATIAATFLTLDDLAADRIICGLGPWWDPLAASVGVDRSKPLLAMREVVTAVRALLERQRVTLQGEFVRFRDVELDVLHGRRQPRQIPIYIGATGPKMMALSGEIADGVLLNYMVSPFYNHAALEHLEIGARKAGRRLETIDRPQLIACSVDRDRARALSVARRVVTMSLRQQPQLMLASGVRKELLDEIIQVMPWSPDNEQLTAAMRLVPDDVVQLVTASGTPEEVKARVRDYIASGATCAVLHPLGDDVNYMIDVFSDGYSNVG